MNIRKIEKIIEDLIGLQGNINICLGNIPLILENKSLVGDALESWVGKYLAEHAVIAGVNITQNPISQTFPDFYLNSQEYGSSYLEIKTFDISAGACFDVANFNSYVDSLIENPNKIDADYLVIAYSLNLGNLKIEKIWIKKVWELTCPSEEWALRLQVKRGMIYNIRPCNLTGSPRFRPFQSREDFLTAIQDVLNKYGETKNKYINWKSEFSQLYTRN